MKIGPVVSEEKILIKIALPVDVENGHSQHAGIQRAGMPVFDVGIPSTLGFQPAGNPARWYSQRAAIQAENERSLDWLNVLRSKFSACIV